MKKVFLAGLMLTAVTATAVFAWNAIGQTIEMNEIVQQTAEMNNLVEQSIPTDELSSLIDGPLVFSQLFFHSLFYLVFIRKKRKQKTA